MITDRGRQLKEVGSSKNFSPAAVANENRSRGRQWPQESVPV